MRSIRIAALLCAGGLLFASACGDDSSTATKDTSATTATTAPSSDDGYGGSPSTSAPAGATDASGSTISVTNGHLVASNGHTLYVFDKDTGTTTGCTGGCVPNWPGLTATGAPTVGSGLDASKASTATTGDVANQVVYNGHLLYEFAGDTKAGDTNGTGIPEWYLVGPDGKKIDDD